MKSALLLFGVVGDNNSHNDPRDDKDDQEEDETDPSLFAGSPGRFDGLFRIPKTSR